MRRSYDNIARYYDMLARMAYGKALIKAQRYLIQAIPAGAHILIVGGGTGWILEEVTKLHPSGLHITYIDSAAKMIELARKRNTGSNHVVFINAPAEQIRHDKEYDVVFTAFFFDNFSQASANAIFKLMDSGLKTGGQWLYADFQLDKNKRMWQKPMIKLMYLFFRRTCGIEATYLPDMSNCFIVDYALVKSRTFFKKFIFADVYNKTS